MRYLTRIVYENWLCYGHVDVELGPKVYAVVARHKDDPERSNWLGKSAFVGGVRFGLDGDHDARTENGWIRRGQRSGKVSLHFDDGVQVARSRILGKSTQLELHRPGEKVAKGDEAQRLIDQANGLSAVDRAATCFLEQGMMNRLMKMLPSKRLEIVSSWFRLDDVRGCSDDVGAACADLSWRAKNASDTLQLVRRNMQVVLGEYGDVDALGNKIEKLKATIEQTVGYLAGLQDKLEKNATLLAASSAIADYERVERDGKALRKEADAIGELAALGEAVTKTSRITLKRVGEMKLAERDVEAKRKVAAGKFDGKCPVAGIQCPATQLINDRVLLNRKALREAEQDLARVTDQHAVASRKETRALAALQRYERAHERLKHLREELKRLYPKYVKGKRLGEAEDQAVLRKRVEEAQLALSYQRAQLASLEHSHTVFLQSREEERSAMLRLEVLEKELVVKREGVQFFKALQRRVAERSLAQVEEGMNGVLSESGIDLGVKLVWSREGEGVAKTCERCGHPFPKSERVKVCERCGSPRGANIIDKLEPELTNRSGGALDLAGLALQLSASRWLRDDRLSQWSCAFIDEPYGALDATHRRALSAHIAGMLRGRYGFEQAFLIAHHASVLDALPGRIEIMAEGSREAITSTARVVA
jgi:hypothetical protein